MPTLDADYSNINYEEMADSIGLNSKHIPMILNAFLEESKEILSSLDLAINDKEYTNIKENAHSIKGSAGNLRFNEIYEMAKEMEFSASNSNADFDYKAYVEAIRLAITTIPK